MKRQNYVCHNPILRIGDGAKGEWRGRRILTTDVFLRVLAEDWDGSRCSGIMSSAKRF